MLKTQLDDEFAAHIKDGLKGIRGLAEALGIFRSPGVPPLALPTVLSAKEYNKKLIQCTFPREMFTDGGVQYPEGTVLWFNSADYEFRAFTADPASMTNEVLFRDGSSETWYVNGRARFFMRIFQTYSGIEVPT